MVAGIGQANPYASNAYTDEMIANVNRDVTSQYQNAIAPNLMAQFNQGGAYGGSAHQQALEGSQAALARELAGNATNVRYANQDNLMRDWYAQLARQQQLNDANYDQYIDARDWQGRQLGILTNALGSIQGGTTSQTGANPNYRSAGQNAATYATLFASLYGGGG